MAAGGCAQFHLGITSRLTNLGHQTEQLTVDVLAEIGRPAVARVIRQAGQVFGHPGSLRPPL